MPRKLLISWCLRVVTLFFFVSFSGSTQSVEHSPEITDGLVWINSARPIKVQKLKGKFVIVYFWNYAYKNIQSLVTQCRELQEKFPTQLVVVGVHTGKALNNDVLNDHIADAMGALRVTHPVVVDAQMQVLKDFRLDKLPSAVLLAPDGEVLFKKVGSENLFYFFNKIIEKNLPQFQNQLDLTVHDFQAMADVSVAPGVSPANPKGVADRTEIVPQPGSLGNRIVEKSTASTQIDVNSLVISEVPSADQQILSERNEVYQADETIAKAPLDIKNFSGQRVVVDREFSRRVQDINFNFGLGTNAQLVEGQRSFVRVYLDDSTIVAQTYVPNLEFRLPLERELTSKQLHVEAVFYYCTHGEKNSCRIKNVLFSIPLVDYPKWEDVEVSYNIPESDT